MRVVIFSDGGSRGNPGDAAIGFVIRKGENTILEYAEPIGIATNNVAEYRAALTAIQKAKALGANEVELYLDSELIQKQLTGAYKVKNEDLQVFYREIQKEISTLKYFSATHVKRALNKEADRLVNEALDNNQKIERRNEEVSTQEFSEAKEDRLEKNIAKNNAANESVVKENPSEKKVANVSPEKRNKKQSLAEQQTLDELFSIEKHNGHEQFIKNFMDAIEVEKKNPQTLAQIRTQIAKFLLENKILYHSILVDEDYCTIVLSVEELKKFSTIVNEEILQQITNSIKIRLEIECLKR